MIALDITTTTGNIPRVDITHVSYANNTIGIKPFTEEDYNKLISIGFLSPLIPNSNICIININQLIDISSFV